MENNIKTNIYFVHLTRLMAALAVVFFHLGANFAKQKYFGVHAEFLKDFFYFGGKAGVAFFFVLSGFLMMYLHGWDVKNKENAIAFIKKRFIRIYPAYWIIFSAVYILAIVTPSLRDAIWLDGDELIKSLTLIPQDKSVVGGTGAPIIVVAWSLQYEIFFYILFSIFIWNPLAALFLLVSVAALLFIDNERQLFISRFLSHPMSSLFLIGCFFGWLGRKAVNFFTAKLMMLLGATVFVLCCISDAETVKYIAEFPIEFLYGFSAAVFICGCVTYEKFNQINPSKLLIDMADSSYALYLMHFPIIAVLCKIIIFYNMDNILYIVASFVVSSFIMVWAAIIFNKKIERPAIKLLNKIFFGTTK